MRRYFIWLPALAWAGVIFFVSAQPKETFDRLGLTGHLLSIGGHFISFGLLMFLTALALYYGSKLPSKYILVTAFVLVALYGLSDEYHQSFVPGRTATLWDWLVDLLGALVVWLIINYHIDGKRVGWLPDSVSDLFTHPR